MFEKIRLIRLGDRMRWLPLSTLIVCMSACGSGPRSFECDGDAACNLAAGGTCIAADSGNRWCAYPDENCPSGYGFSEEDAGDDLAGTCVPGSRYKLTVTLEGSAGTVTSQPDGMTCSAATCTALFREGSVVELTPQATADQFLSWSGACSGRGACSITMDGDKDVQVLFGKPGQVLWAKQFGSSNDTGLEFARAIAIDSRGDLIIVGAFENTISVKPGTDLTSSGSTDILVMKIASATGAVVWAQKYGGADGQDATDVALDSQDNIYVSGTFGGLINFGGSDYLQADPYGDAYALKLRPDGSYLWAKKLGGAEFQGAQTIAVNGGNVVVAGTFEPSITIGATTLTTGGNQQDIYIATLSGADGSVVWAKSFGGTSYDDVAAIDIDRNGSVLATGRIDSPVNFGGGVLTPAGRDVFILKLAGSTGAHQVSARFGAAGIDTGQGISADSLNNIVLTGDFNGTVDFGCAAPVVASQADRNDMFLAKFSPAGSCLWAKGFGGTGGTGVYGPHPFGGLVTNAANDIAVVGQFCGTISFGGSVLAAAGSCPQTTDIFAARLDANGNHLTSIRGGGTGEEYAYGIAQASDGRTFVVGGFAGFAEFGATTLTSGGTRDLLVVGLAPL